MGFDLGFNFGSSTSKSTSTGSFDRATMPVIPDWLSTGVEDTWRALTRAAENPSQYYPGLNQLQQRAALEVQDLDDMDWNFNKAALGVRDVLGASAPSMTAASLLEGLDKYMSPYTRDVVDFALLDYDRGADRQLAQANLDLAGSSAFGGSGAGLRLQGLGRDLASGRGSMAANLRDQAFTRGAQLSGEDAQRRQAASEANARFALEANAQRLQAAQALTGLSRDYQDLLRANVETKWNIGDALHTADKELAQAPLTTLGWLTGNLENLPTAGLIGERSTGTETQTTKGKQSNLGFNFGYSHA